MCLKTFVEKLGLSKQTLCLWTKPYDTLLGKVTRTTTMGLDRLAVRQVRVKRQTFDEYLKMYFTKSIDYWVWDKHDVTKLGDVVLITPLKEEEKPSVSVHHEMKRVVFKHGYRIDPVTKKRLFETDLMDDVEQRSAFIDEAYNEGLEAIKRRLSSRQQSALRKDIRRKLLLDPPKYSKK